MKQTVSRAERQQQLKRNEQKWTRTLMDAGWTVFPSVVLARQNGLGLDAIDVNILLQLATYWWFSENPPHPSKATIALAMGVSVSTIRKRVARMESEGLIRRVKRIDAKHGGQQTNFYRFDGLIEKCRPYALEEIEARELKRKEKDARRMRKRPKLALVPGNSASKPAVTGRKPS